MPGLLRHRPVTDEQRRANDRHRPLVVVAVLGLIALYAYLFTGISHTLDLPPPGEVATRLGISVDHVFDEAGQVQSGVYISYTELLDGDTERLVFYAVLVAAFLLSYFLPLPYKQGALVATTVVAMALLYGLSGLAGLLLAHSLVYLTLHPSPHHRLLAMLPAWLVYFTFTPTPPTSPGRIAFLVLAPVASLLAYRLVVLRVLAAGGPAKVIRTVVVQSPLITVMAFAIVEGVTSEEWDLPVGILLFFWQWARVIMYHVDYDDGLVPRDLPFVRYLAVFLSPGVIPVWQWGIAVGQGYSYLTDNYLCQDKNKIVLSGVRLLLVALGYLVLWDWASHLLVSVFEGLGVRVYGGTTLAMVDAHMRGANVSTVSVLMTTCLDLARWIMMWGGVFHFKVGVWRICGYRVDPYFDRPWRSTNLIMLWSRLTFHYREFLVRAFYYPFFFRFLRGYPKTRIVAATMFAAGFANLVWGHITERMYYGGMVFDNFVVEVSTWPYFLLLGAGISLTELYKLHRKHPRKPWTPGLGIIGDVVAAYCTLQFFTMLRIFRRPTTGSTAWDLFELFLRGFGIHL